MIINPMLSQARAKWNLSDLSCSWHDMLSNHINRADTILLSWSIVPVIMVASKYLLLETFYCWLFFFTLLQVCAVVRVKTENIVQTLLQQTTPNTA